jgi:malate permease and related proteins
VILGGGLAKTALPGVPMIEAQYRPQFMAVGIVAHLLGSQVVLAVLGIALAGCFSAGPPRPGLGAIVLRILQFPPFVATIAAFDLTPATFSDWLHSMEDRRGGPHSHHLSMAAISSSDQPK